jgi:hypothetical protein
MNDQRSKARAHYEATYRDLRLNGGWPDEERFFTYYDEIQDCALDCYDNRQADFTGWLNAYRRRMFVAKLGEDPLWRIPF